jgi:hypothetical protein
MTITPALSPRAVRRRSRAVPSLVALVNGMLAALVALAAVLLRASAGVVGDAFPEGARTGATGFALIACATLTTATIVLVTVVFRGPPSRGRPLAIVGLLTASAALITTVLLAVTL